MNDQDICVAAMSEWPVEARPTHIKYGATGHASRPECFIDILPTGGCRMLMDHHAQAIFRDSGLAWLLRNNGLNGLQLWPPEPDSCDQDYQIDILSPAIESTDIEMFTGPTLLAAIDSAIRSLSPASEKEKPR